MRGQWQFAQGGLNEGEDPLNAAWREMREETGLGPNEVMLVAEHPGWIVYEYPPEIAAKRGRLGQAHRWYLFDALRSGVAPTPDGLEFVAWQWVTREWMLEHAVDFRQPGYERVLGEWW